MTDILVVDDSTTMRKIAVRMLQAAGVSARESENGQAALEAIKRAPPTACILDVNMPGMDGFTVLKRMRADPLTAHVPVLILTARRAPDDIKTAIRLGATDYLTKPFNDEQLLSRVARLLRKRTEPPKVVYV